MIPEFIYIPIVAVANNRRDSIVSDTFCYREEEDCEAVEDLSVHLSARWSVDESLNNKNRNDPPHFPRRQPERGQTVPPRLPLRCG